MKTSYKKKKQGNSISLRDVFEFVAGRWYWFFLSVSILVGGMWYYLVRQQPTYQRTSTILLKDDKATRGDSFVFTFGVQENGDLNNKLHILTSSELMRMVVTKLNLDVSYSTPLTFRNQDLYKNSPINVSFLNKYAGIVNMEITPLSDEKCSVVMNDQTFVCEFNDTLSINKQKIIISPTAKLTITENQAPIYVSRISTEMAALRYKGSIIASPVEESSMVNLTCISTSVKKSDDILNALLDAYNEYSERDQRRIADNTARFLEERINAVTDDLDNLSNEMPAGMKSKVATLEVGGRSSYLADAGRGREEALHLETSMSMAKYVQSYLQDTNNQKGTIPNLGGMTETGIGTQVDSYNAMVIQYERLLENSGPNNSVVQKLQKTMEATRASIKNSLDAYIHSLQIKLDQARKQERTAQYSLTNDQGAYDIYRQKEIKKSLHALLLKKQEENALSMVITDAAAKLVEPPFSSAAPSPHYPKNLATAFIVGLLIPVGVWWLLVSLDTKVRNAQDIEDATSLDIIGEIPAYEPEKKEKDAIIAVKYKENDALTESFRVLCAHLSLALKGQKVVMLTSTTSGEGKSFVSSNLAASLAMSGKKTILVDLDIRKPKKSGLQKNGVGHPGVTDFLKGKIEDLQSLIIPSTESHMPDILPSGHVTSNPIEMLSGDNLDRMIDELRKTYQCIIIDSVPAKGLADALLMNRVADLTVYVVRERLLDRRFLPELERMYQEDKLKNMHVILNNCQFYKRSYYGYYGYSKYYGYGYAYGNY